MSSYLISALSSGVSSQFSSASIDNVGAALGSTSTNMQALSVSAINRGAAAAQSKNYDLAIQEFKRGAAYDPTNTNVYSYMGQVYLMAAKPAEAIAAYKKGLQIDPTYDDLRNQLASAYISTNDYPNAEKELQALARTNPTNAGPPTELGQIYLSQGRLAEADTQFTRVTHIAPKSTTAFYNLGLVRNEQGNYADAKRLFQHALDLDPKNESAMTDLAYSYVGLGDTDSAKNQYKQLMAQGTASAQTLAQGVLQAINTPKIFYEDPSQSNFSSLLGPGTAVSALDPSLATAGASKVFKLTFMFNNPMDVASITNIANWSISKAAGGDAGVYNSGGSTTDTQGVNLPPLPMSVTYDPKTYMATVYFKVTQNATANGTIDPKHWVFQFNGKDSFGRGMDKTGNQYDGHHITPF